MKKSRNYIAAAVLAGLLCLMLTGCAPSLPSRAADGKNWDSGWVMVGNVVGVDTPAGMVSRENDDIMAKKNLYYAAWSMGEAEDYVNQYGMNSSLYDAQMFLMLAGYDSAATAETNRQEMLEMAREQYRIEETFEAIYNGQSFTMITYSLPSDTNPYARGASAFGVYRNYTVSAELTCRERSDGDALAILEDFLAHCHYAA